MFLAEEYLKGLLLGTIREKIREKNERAVPWQRAKVCMLRHLGRHACENGYFWDKTPDRLPENFLYDKTRRWFSTFRYINQFRGSALYLENAVAWILENAREDGLWDWGTQVKDPWGYFGYFSCNRNYRHNRVVDCTVEVLDFLKRYVDHNKATKKGAWR